MALIEDIEETFLASSFPRSMGLVMRARTRRMQEKQKKTRKKSNGPSSPRKRKSKLEQTKDLLAALPLEERLKILKGE